VADLEPQATREPHRARPRNNWLLVFAVSLLALIVGGLVVAIAKPVTKTHVKTVSAPLVGCRSALAKLRTTQLAETDLLRTTINESHAMDDAITAFLAYSADSSQDSLVKLSGTMGAVGAARDDVNQSIQLHPIDPSTPKFSEVQDACLGI
jgi:hypothetical protein